MKKKIIIIASVLLVLFIGLQVIGRLDFVRDDNSYVDPDSGNTDNGSQGFIPNKNPRDLYEPDWETDIFTLDKYLEKNRYMKYGAFTGSGVELAELLLTRTDCKVKGGAPLEAMYDYFYYVIRGDHSSVNGMYSSDFFENENNTPHAPHNAFPMQKVYDLFVRSVAPETLEGWKGSDTDKNDGVTSFYYLVTYKIMENDGLFRYEIDADAEMVQLFEVRVYDNGSPSKIGLILDLPGFNVYS